MTTNDSRVDTTFIGYLLIGFVLLLSGILGLQLAELFGQSYTDMPIDEAVFAKVSGLVGVILILLMIFAYRTGNKTSAGVFALFGTYFIFDGLVVFAMNDVTTITNSMWFLFVAVAIFFLIFAIYEAFDKAPKFLAVLLLLAALTVFFIGLSTMTGSFGTDNVDLHKAFSLVNGIFGLLGFIVAVYLGLAYANPKKVPLI